MLNRPATRTLDTRERFRRSCRSELSFGQSEPDGALIGHRPLRTNNRYDGLSSLPAVPGGEPFEESGLGQRTDFQSRAPRAGADFKAMAIDRLREAGATIERLDFEVNQFPVDAQISGPNGASSSCSHGAHRKNRTGGHSAVPTPLRRPASWRCNWLAARPYRSC